MVSILHYIHQSAIISLYESRESVMFLYILLLPPPMQLCVIQCLFVGGRAFFNNLPISVEEQIRSHENFIRDVALDKEVPC